MENQENSQKLYALTYESPIWHQEIIYGVFTTPTLAEWTLIDLVQSDKDDIAENEERMKIRRIENGHPQTEWEIIKNYNDDDTYNEFQEYF